MRIIAQPLPVEEFQSDFCGELREPDPAERTALYFPPSDRLLLLSASLRLLLRRIRCGGSVLESDIMRLAPYGDRAGASPRSRRP
jgi:hypothetical protein